MLAEGMYSIPPLALGAAECKGLSRPNELEGTGDEDNDELLERGDNSLPI